MSHSVGHNESIKSEDQLQACCFQWHWNTYPDKRKTLFHVQQKAKNAIEGNRFKALGVVTGVSDLILLHNKTAYFIELKFEDGRQSKEQIVFQSIVEAMGFEYVVLDTFEDFKNYIRSKYAK